MVYELRLYPGLGGFRDLIELQRQLVETWPRTELSQIFSLGVRICREMFKGRPERRFSLTSHAGRVGDALAPCRFAGPVFTEC